MTLKHFSHAFYHITRGRGYLEFMPSLTNFQLSLSKDQLPSGKIQLPLNSFQENVK